MYFLCLLAQAAGERQDAIQQQNKSIEAQRASVRRQAEGIHGGAPAGESSFFTVAWPGGAQAQDRESTSGEQPDCDPLPKEELAAYIEEASRRDGLTPDLLRAMIGKESSYRPCAVSPKGAQGLMQLMPATAAMLRVDDPFNPRQNINGGSRLMRRLLDRYGGDLALALGAYNAGPEAVDRNKGLPMFPETINYVGEILRKLGID